MRITKDAALAVLNEIVREGETIKHVTETSLTEWDYQLEQAMDRVFSNNSAEHGLMNKHTNEIGMLGAMMNGGYSNSQAYAEYGGDQIRKQTSSLKKIIGNIESEKIIQIPLELVKTQVNLDTDPLLHLERICLNFHAIQKQLRKRREDRPTLIVKDEYDTQDLFHSLLHLYFDDIRPEDSVPSQAGSNSRVDFLLKREKIVIEIKKTRKGLADKKLGEELIIDIDRYRSHQNCNFLFCFVYDPDGFILNPRGLEDDLKRAEENFGVRVMIVSS